MTQTTAKAEAIGRAVVENVAPDEMPYFTLAAERFRRLPNRPPATDGDDQLGFGVEIAAVLTPTILWLSQVAVEALKKQMKDGVENAVAAWFASVVRAVKSVFAGKSAARPSPAKQTPALSPAAIRHVRSVVRGKAVKVAKLSPEQADRVADAIAVALLENA